MLNLLRQRDIFKQREAAFAIEQIYNSLHRIMIFFNMSLLTYCESGSASM